MDLDDLKKTLRTMAPGPYMVDGRYTIANKGAEIAEASCPHDATDIVKILNAAPKLIAELEAARKVIEALKGELDGPEASAAPFGHTDEALAEYDDVKKETEA